MKIEEGHCSRNHASRPGGFQALLDSLDECVTAEAIASAIGVMLSVDEVRGAAVDLWSGPDGVRYEVVLDVR